MTYKAPLKDMLFNIQHLANIEEVAKIPGFEEAGFETAQAVLEECAKFNESVLSPLNWEGDKNPSSFKGGVVTTPPVSSKPSSNTWKVAGKACSILLPTAARACRKPLARFAPKCSTRPT